MSFDNRFIEDLKNRIDIVNIIGKDVSLKKKGANYWGNCPFHNEKTPSFSVNEEKQFYHCFGCGVGGDVIKFVQDFYKLDFNEAITKICADNGIELPKMVHRSNVDYKRFYEINRLTATYYFQNLRKLPNLGYKYISNRKIDNQALNKFGIGFSNNSWDGLYKYLHSQNIKDEEMLKLGLVKKGKNNKLYDKFRNRIMFPIIDTRSRVIGFGGRSVSNEDKPKYLNSDESDIFHKKNNLYGLNIASEYIKKEGNIIIVEGYMDVISLYQSGIRNVIASLGTALTDEQARLISRYTKNIILSYDSDEAGIKANLRAIEVFRKSNLNVKVIQIEGGKDPDEYVKKYGKDKFKNLVSNALPSTDFILITLKRNFDLKRDEDKLKYIKECIRVLNTLSPVEQDFYIKKISRELDISEQAIRTEVSTRGREEVKRYTNERGIYKDNINNEITAILKTELYLLYISSLDLYYLKKLEKDNVIFTTYLAKKIHKILIEILNKDLKNNSYNSKDINLNIIDEISKNLDKDEDMAFRKATKGLFIGGDIEEFYNKCLKKYKLEICIERKNQLQNELEVSEKINDNSSSEDIAKELLFYESEIRRLKGD